MQFLTYDSNGNFTGAHIQDVVPDGAAYLEVDDATYANWVNYRYVGGQIVAKPALDQSIAAWAAYQQQALAALSDSDITLLRCYENAVAVPAAWTTYRKALRAIVGAASGDATQPFPAKPAYPDAT